MEFFLRQVYPWMIEISSLSIGVPLLVGIFLMKKQSSLIFRLLMLYTVFMALSELLGQLTVYFGTKNNMWISHIFTPIEFGLVAALFYFNTDKRIIRRGIIFATVGFVIVSVLNVVWGEGITQMNSTPRVLGAAIIILMAIIYFYEAAIKLKHTYIDRDPMFLMSSALIIYKSGTSLAYGMFNQALAESYDTARMCLTVILVLNILFRLILTLAIIRASKV